MDAAEALTEIRVSPPCRALKMLAMPPRDECSAFAPSHHQQLFMDSSGLFSPMSPTLKLLPVAHEQYQQMPSGCDSSSNSSQSKDKLPKDSTRGSSKGRPANAAKQRRDRNREAAKRSRAKKAERLSGLQMRNCELEQQVGELRMRLRESMLYIDSLNARD